MRIKKAYHDTNQTDKATEQKLRREAAVIGELKRKYNCVDIGKGPSKHFNVVVTLFLG